MRVRIMLEVAPDMEGEFSEVATNERRTKLPRTNLDRVADLIEEFADHVRRCEVADFEEILAKGRGTWSPN